MERDHNDKPSSGEQRGHDPFNLFPSQYRSPYPPPSGSRGVGGALLGLTTRLRLQKGRVEHVGGADAEPGQSPGLSRPWRCGKAGGRPSPGIEAAK